MRIETDFGKIEVVNEPTYTFGSVDNVRTYPFTKKYSTETAPFARYGILLNGEPLAIFGDCGYTSVGEHSAIYLKGQVFLAIGKGVVCFCPKPFDLRWQLQVDTFTCFGIHYQSEQEALISHGEIEISRFSEDGRILWRASGEDIFTQGFALLPQCIEAVDFNYRVYRFNYATGAK